MYKILLSVFLTLSISIIFPNSEDLAGREFELEHISFSDIDINENNFKSIIDSLIWTDDFLISKHQFENAKNIVFKAQNKEELALNGYIFLESFYENFTVFNDNEFIYSYNYETDPLTALHTIKVDNLKLNNIYVSLENLKIPTNYEIQLFFIGNEKENFYLEVIQDYANGEMLTKMIAYGFGILFCIGLVYLIKIRKLNNQLIAFLLFSLLNFIDFFATPFFLQTLGITPKIRVLFTLFYDEIYGVIIIYIITLVYQQNKNKIINLYLITRTIIAVSISIFFVFAPQNLLTFSSELILTFTDILIAFAIIFKYKKIVNSKTIFLSSLMFLIIPLISLLSDSGFLAKSSLLQFLIGSEVYYSGLTLTYFLLINFISMLFVYALLKQYHLNQIDLQKYQITLTNKENEILQLQQENLKVELAALKNQINPHFLFNSLATLISLINEDQERATLFAEEFSSVFRFVLQTGNKNVVTLEEELENLDSYIFLLFMRYNKNLIVDLNIDEELNFRMIPPLTLQMLVENVIKHNTIDSRSPIIIYIHSNNEYVCVKNKKQLKQDFVGKKYSESFGIGLANINKRYKLLAQSQIDVIDNDNEFIVKIPLLKN